MNALERQIQNAIFAALGAEPDLLLLRNNIGVADYPDPETGKVAKVAYGLGVGSPDLVAFLEVPGRGIAAALAWEVKQPGEGPTPAQRKCHGIWRRFGVRVAVVHSVDEARDALAAAREAVRR